LLSQCIYYASGNLGSDVIVRQKQQTLWAEYKDGRCGRNTMCKNTLFPTLWWEDVGENTVVSSKAGPAVLEQKSQPEG